ncbi:BatD family protein [Reinekea blandensis]|uniref:Protein BatD n=1 Tax=Reinekea blandensis MED297 TaxID=314283 RepID=A4BEC2_9GAMM|nr:BatD family protein [Reinekea blandensis]EAR09600.1 hypothetical protein MED297_12752 [Reinekea blandensis MED297]
MVRQLSIFLLLLVMTAANAEVISITDRTELYDDERFTLTVRVSPIAELNPDELEALARLFTIEQQFRQERRQRVNGQEVGFVDYQFRLRPKQPGQVIIPAFEVNGDSSDPISLDVQDASQRPDSLPDDAVILSTSLNQSNIYIDQSLRLTLSLAYNIEFRNGELSAFNPEGFTTELIDESRSTTQINGQPYNQFTRVIELTPEKAGLFTLPAIRFSAEYANRNLGRFQRFSRATDAISIQVKAVPDAYPSDAFWLPAESITLSDNLDAELTVKQNEHLDWQLQMDVIGLPAEKLPPILEQIESALPDEVRLYRNPADVKAQSRHESLALSFTEPGTYTIPEIRIPWWDLSADQLSIARLPAKTIEVTGSVTAPISQTENRAPQAQADTADGEPPLNKSDLQPAPSKVWPLLTAIAGAGWLGTLLLWWWSMRRRPPAQTPSKATKTEADEHVRSLAEGYQFWLKLRRSGKIQSIGPEDQALFEQLEAHLLFQQRPAPELSEVTGALRRLRQTKTKGPARSASPVGQLYPQR